VPCCSSVYPTNKKQTVPQARTYYPVIYVYILFYKCRIPIGSVVTTVAPEKVRVWSKEAIPTFATHIFRDKFNTQIGDATIHSKNRPQ
jgi:hypothetical protein